MIDLDELKAEWFEFGRSAGLREAEERIINLLVSVFDKPWSVSSREELEAFIRGER